MQQLSLKIFVLQLNYTALYSSVIMTDVKDYMRLTGLLKNTVKPVFNGHLNIGEITCPYMTGVLS